MATKYGYRWETIEQLGEGGQAHTFLVKDLQGSGEPRYVLKRLKNLNRIERFKREIETIRNLNHTNIVRLIDFNLDAEKPYLVTEYCSGGNLAAVTPYWRKSPVEGLHIFLQICEGVAYAHSKGIIHRDIKPDNIFLRTEEGPAVVGDFGICFIEDDGARLTITEEAVGPRNYIAPELEDGRLDQISTKCDIYSLGKLLYWIISGNTYSREKHRETKWDIKGANNNTDLGWDNIYLEHINRLLDLMVISDINARRDVDNILILTKNAIRLIQKEFTPVSTTIKQPCLYCGQGHYVSRADQGNSAAITNFGMTPRGTVDLRIYTCNKCGHVQMFRVDLAEMRSWWQ
jgi:serine/threonine protein kinase